MSIGNVSCIRTSLLTELFERAALTNDAWGVFGGLWLSRIRRTPCHPVQRTLQVAAALYFCSRLKGCVTHATLFFCRQCAAACIRGIRLVCVCNALQSGMRLRTGVCCQTCRTPLCAGQTRSYIRRCSQAAHAPCVAFELRLCGVCDLLGCCSVPAPDAITPCDAEG